MPYSTFRPGPSAFGVAVLSKQKKNFMTMPSERTRSVIQTREFLIELSRNTDFPATIRREAKQLLTQLIHEADLKTKMASGFLL